MNYREILTRITGFSVPVFGVSWNPREPEIDIARRVLTFLEDRRVLYNPYHIEVAEDCVRSVLDIRRFLTTEISGLAADSELAKHLRGIRAACRKFLDDTDHRSRRVAHPHRSGWHEAGFFTQSGELRAAIGMHVAAIAVMYGVDVEGELAGVLPSSDEDSVGDDRNDDESR